MLERGTHHTTLHSRNTLLRGFQMNFLNHITSPQINIWRKCFVSIPTGKSVKVLIDFLLASGCRSTVAWELRGSAFPELTDEAGILHNLLFYLSSAGGSENDVFLFCISARDFHQWLFLVRFSKTRLVQLNLMLWVKFRDYIMTEFQKEILS